MSVWTEEFTEMALELWRQGVGAREIAAQLRAEGCMVSRYAVVCRMHRIGQQRYQHRTISLVGPAWSIPAGYARANSEEVAA